VAAGSNKNECLVVRLHVRVIARVNNILWRFNLRQGLPL
jgi:hypothetical protein